MDEIKLRNKTAEDNYFRLLRRWRDATGNLDAYDESTLKFLFNNMAFAFRSVGYIFGDRQSDLEQNAPDEIII